MATKYKNRKGVQSIHLFNEVWRIGRLTQMKKTCRLHCVIYSPDDKEYHVYDNEAVELRSKSYDYDDNEIVLRGRANLAKVKIYILTHILSDEKDWKYDLAQMPDIGTPIQVIYDNGTIKNIEFDSKFKSISIPNNRFTADGVKIEFEQQHYKKIKPICWKLK